MHRARTFFYVAAGVFLLALAYHLGARNAGAQDPGYPIAAAVSNGSGQLWVFASNGDVYHSNNEGVTWTYRANVHMGTGPTNVQRESWGQLKQQYRDP